MNKGIVVHYKNVFKGGRVEASDDKIDVYCKDNVHRVALRKGGDGAVRDVSAELGCTDQHCMDPIPKNTRVFKLHVDGTIGVDELATERYAISDKVEKQNKVLGITAYKKLGYKFDKEGNIEIPAPELVTPPPAAPQDPA